MAKGLPHCAHGSVANFTSTGWNRICRLEVSWSSPNHQEGTRPRRRHVLGGLLEYRRPRTKWDTFGNPKMEVFLPIENGHNLWFLGGVAKFDLQSTDLVMLGRSYKRVLPHGKIWHGFTFKRFGANYGPSIFHPFLTCSNISNWGDLFVVFLCFFPVLLCVLVNL